MERPEILGEWFCDFMCAAIPAGIFGELFGLVGMALWTHFAVPFWFVEQFDGYCIGAFIFMWLVFPRHAHDRR